MTVHSSEYWLRLIAENVTTLDQPAGYSANWYLRLIAGGAQDEVHSDEYWLATFTGQPAGKTNNYYYAHWSGLSGVHANNTHLEAIYANL